MVGVTSVIGAAAAYRSGEVLLVRGLAFGSVAIAGAAAGSLAATRVDPAVLMASFATLMLAVAVSMAIRLVRDGRRGETREGADDGRKAIVSFTPTFRCRCTLALKVLTTATAIGLLTGFLGVGGGFLVVPALLLVLSIPMRYAIGTSLVVIAMTSAAALMVRASSGAAHPDWILVGALTVASASAAAVGARLARHVDTRQLSMSFTGLVLVVAIYTAARAIPALG